MTISGIVLLDKPAGMTSNKVLQILKRIFRAKKAGHTGSLDPLATGMLPICFGDATKYSQYMLDADKQYTATAKLGIKTDTSDSDGIIIQTKPVENITAEKIENVLKKFRGEILQIPSMFSALKHNGQPLYELARKGIQVERKARPITIFELELKSFSVDEFSIHVHCSKGTYIRNLVEDIGDELGCGAHVIGLRRTAVGHFTPDQMIPLSQFDAIKEAQDWGALDPYLLPMDELLEGTPKLIVDTQQEYALRHGQRIEYPNPPESDCIRLYSSEGHFFGVAKIHEKTQIAPKKLVSA